MKPSDRICCSLHESWAQNYLDDTLSPGERLLYEGHLEQCPQCRAAVSIFQQLFTVLENEASPKIPSSLMLLQEQWLKDYLKDEKSTLTASTLLKLQARIASNTTRFMQWLPGIYLGTKVTEKTTHFMAKQVKQKAGRFFRQKGKALLAR